MSLLVSLLMSLLVSPLLVSLLVSGLSSFSLGCTAMIWGITTPLWARTEKQHRMNSHLIIHFPTSEGVSEVSEQANE